MGDKGVRPTKLDDRQNHIRDVARLGGFAKVCRCAVIAGAVLAATMSRWGLPSAVTQQLRHVPAVQPRSSSEALADS